VAAGSSTDYLQVTRPGIHPQRIMPPAGQRE
jgi:hypothetical protein